MMAGGDRAAFYQLRTILEGVVARGTAASMQASDALRRRQDRHHRQRERRLVRRLHQRRHRRGLGRLRQRPGQADARPRLDRRPDRRSDRRADHPGHLESSMGRKRRCRRPRRKPRAISRRCRSITPAARSSPPTARTGSPSISSSTPTRSCGTLNIRWPGAAAWRAASRGPAWQAVLGPVPARTLSRSGRNMCRRPRAARLPPSNRVPRNLRELFGL